MMDENVFDVVDETVVCPACHQRWDRDEGTWVQRFGCGHLTICRSCALDVWAAIDSLSRTWAYQFRVTAMRDVVPAYRLRGEQYRQMMAERAAKEGKP